MKHLFVIDPLSKLHPQLDSSLKLARELLQLGESVWTCEARSLVWSAATPECTASSFPEQISSRMSLDAFDAIHMRKDPPYDLSYISVLWMLDAAKARIYNAPQGLLRLNEKVAILEFPEYRDAALLCIDSDRAQAFVEQECSGDAVLKPLAMYGGIGIKRVDSSFDFVSFFRDNPYYHLLQPFNSAIYQGEVRAFTVCGKAISWCLKKPKAGEFMANSNFGSTRHQYHPSPKEIHTVEDMAKRLLNKYQLKVIGFDMIGGKVSEINVTSPRLLHADDDQTPYYETFAKLILQDLH